MHHLILSSAINEFLAAERQNRVGPRSTRMKTSRKWESLCTGIIKAWQATHEGADHVVFRRPRKWEWLNPPYTYAVHSVNSVGTIVRRSSSSGKLTCRPMSVRASSSLRNCVLESQFATREFLDCSILNTFPNNTNTQPLRHHSIRSVYDENCIRGNKIVKLQHCNSKTITYHVSRWLLWGVYEIKRNYNIH